MESGHFRTFIRGLPQALFSGFLWGEQALNISKQIWPDNRSRQVALMMSRFFNHPMFGSIACGGGACHIIITQADRDNGVVLAGDQ